MNAVVQRRSNEAELIQASDKAGKLVFETYRGGWGRFLFSEEKLRAIEDSGK